MNRTERIQKAAAMLYESIPAPYKPSPKTQLSWATLKVGDKIQGKAIGSSVATVVLCTNQGATLEFPDSTTRILNDRDWKTQYNKLGKASRGKKSNR